MSNTRTIARNTGWYGLETIFGSVSGLLASIAVARILGPSKMGYIIYVMFIANVVSNLGGLGIPATTQKYMAEFIGMGDRGTARYIYFRTLFLQIGVATLATGGILFWVLRDANAEYKVASLLVVLSIWPAMVNSISAMANAATEELSKNMPASLIATLTYLVVIAAMLVFKWGVTGVGAAFFSMRALEFLVRLFPTMRRILAWDKVHIQPPGLPRRMMTFAWQSVASMTLALVVWNRSEVILLKHLCSDIRQIAYYSLAFSMAEQLLLGATIFGAAASVTIFAQYGRDKSRLSAIASSTVRYLALTSIPLHFIAAALAAPALLLLYGNQYRGAVMVATVAPILCLPKAFIGPVQSLLESAERQSYVIAATVFAGIVDIGVAWYLIPAHGAVGACIGSGAAQVMAVGTMWAVGIHLYKVKLPWLHIAKIAFISTLAAVTAHFIAARLAPLWAILFGGSASLIVLFGLSYLMRVLEPEDQDRFKILTGMLPRPIARPVNKVLLLLIRPEFGGVTPAEVIEADRRKHTRCAMTCALGLIAGKNIRVPKGAYPSSAMTKLVRLSQVANGALELLLSTGRQRILVSGKSLAYRGGEVEYFTGHILRHWWRFSGARQPCFVVTGADPACSIASATGCDPQPAPQLWLSSHHCVFVIIANWSGTPAVIHYGACPPAIAEVGRQVIGLGLAASDPQIRHLLPRILARLTLPNGAAILAQSRIPAEPYWLSWRRIDVATELWLSRKPASENTERAWLGQLLPQLCESFPQFQDLLFPPMDALLKWCESTRIPGNVMHGDFSLKNVLFQGDIVSGIVDWEGAQRNGFLQADVLYMLFGSMAEREVSLAHYLRQFWADEIGDIALSSRIAKLSTWSGMEMDKDDLKFIALLVWFNTLKQRSLQGSPMAARWVEDMMPRTIPAIMKWLGRHTQTTSKWATVV